jgi:glycosyltransferase involved in cell wall biosynthesis
MHNLSVIIPFFNEKEFLLDSVNRVLETGIAHQIFLSDDFSNDGSEIIAKKLSEEHEFITYIRSDKNKGKGSALNNVKKYIETSHVVIHDADLEYFPSDIVEMFEVSKDNPECLVLGTRFTGEKERKNVYFRTGLANRVMSLFFSVVNFTRITDVATCYKLMPTQFFQSISLKEKGFSVEIEILSKFLKTNNKIKEVPIKYEGRTYSEGKKIKTLDGFMYLFNTLKYRFFN